jgi:integral membrane protein
MIHLFKTKIGRLRLLGYAEGITLLALVFIATPMKYLFDDPSLTRSLGPVHGAVFLVFVLNAASVAIEQNWEFRTTTWKVIAACFIPFGTFYIDRKILKKYN